MTSSSTDWIQSLGMLLDKSQIATGNEDLVHYGKDWTKVFPPRASAVVFPKTIDEVQSIVKFARKNAVAIVPSGGRTGLSGGAVACKGEMVVSMEKMNQVLAFDSVERTVRCQAGVITQTIQELAKEKGLFYPVDFASCGSSQIGGNISTNAGGIKVIRYGMTRDWVLGLKVVTGSGEVLDLNKGLIKNATGYDFRHLFIGAEGTLGLVVEATLGLTRPPENPLVLVLGVSEFESLMNVLSAFQSKFDLEAFEFFSDKALAKVLAKGTLQAPFESASKYFALLEVAAIRPDTPDELMSTFEYCVEQGWVEDGVMSQSIQQAAQLWRLREEISETIAPFTPYKNDISVSVSKVPAFLDEVERLVNESYPGFEIIWFGHIGDGNLHLNILKPERLDKADFFKKCHGVTEMVSDLVRRYDGSISAEHGVGLLKKNFLQYTRSETEIELMRQIKKSFDPDNIMNPGKVFDV